MAFTENFNEFFDTKDFAVTAAYLAVDSEEEAVTINGIFDKAYQLLDGGDVGISGTTPVFHCKTSDVPTAAQGDTLLVEGILYEVVEPMPDGTGTTILRLIEADIEEEAP